MIGSNAVTPAEIKLQMYIDGSRNSSFSQARWRSRKTLRSSEWSRRTARGPACTRPPPVCMCVCVCARARKTVFRNVRCSHKSSFSPLICAFVGSGAERVCPPGASARGGEDHCGGDEEQRPDGYWREVRALLLRKQLLICLCNGDKRELLYLLCLDCDIFSNQILN